MTLPPLPASPCVKCSLGYSHDTGLKGGSRFYLTYAGSAPTGSDAATLATDIAAAWASHIQSQINSDWSLTEVDVLDIASRSGFSGQWTGGHGGTETGTPVAAAAAMNVEFGIARRYRGGKPRMFLPGGVTADQDDDATWSSAYISTTHTNVVAFFTALEALSIGAIGALNHVNLSYYESFTNITNTSGRTRAAPKYRTGSAVVDNITGYFPKQRMGSQRRRRSSTTY